MPEYGIYAIGVLATLTALTAPLELGFGAVLACWLLVPGLLVMPGLPHVLAIDRLVLYVFALRLVARLGRPGEPAPSAFRLTKMHIVVCIWAVVGFVDGVMLASPRTYFPSDMDSWFTGLDVLVLFVCALAVIRTLGAWRVTRTAVVLLGVTFAIAVVERITKSGWSHFLYEHVPDGYKAPGSAPLGQRAGVRVQVAAQFGLEYGWLVAMLTPLVLAAALHWSRRRLRGVARGAVLLPLAALLVVAFNQSRSADVAVAVGTVVAVLLIGVDRRMVRWAAVGIAALVVLGAAFPSIVSSPFHVASTTDSVSVRLARLGQVFTFVVGRAFQGLGYQGTLNFVPIPGLDDTYATTYVTLGVIGLVAWAALLASGIATGLRCLRARRGGEIRTLGAACAVGMALTVVGGFAYDLSGLTSSTWAFVFMAALATSLAERVPARPPARLPARWLLPVAGVGVGALVLLVAPTSASQVFVVDTQAPWISATSAQPADPYVGSVLTNTFCGTVTAPGLLTPGNTVTCTSLADTSLWPAAVSVAVAGPDARAVTAQARRIFGAFPGAELSNTPAGRVHPGEIWVAGDITSGRPAWATTAPLWVGAVGLGLCLLAPVLAWRRRHPVAHRPSVLVPA